MSVEDADTAIAGPDGVPLDAPYAMAADAVLGVLDVTPAQGLSARQAARRRAQYGPNSLRQRRAVSALRILVNQFRSPVVLLLAMAAAVALASAHWTEALTIALVLVINAMIGFFTEIRATRSMEALRVLGSPMARVRRGSQVRMVPARALVPGDIVIVEGGDVVGADIRLVEAANVAVDQSALTGESVAVDKDTAKVGDDAPVPDRSPILYQGTSVVRGSGVGVVVATGMRTELGQISRLVEQAAPEASPLERQLTRLSGQLMWLTIVIVIVIGAVGILTDKDPFVMIEAAIALAVAAIPEGLPVVATMALARGMLRMARANALVERLSAVETLGATTVVMTDKTGTLTENTLTVAEIVTASGRHALSGAAEAEEAPRPPGDEAFARAIRAMVLCTNAELGGDAGDANAEGTGDPLELALLRAGRRLGEERQALLARFPRVREEAFASETKRMATVHSADGGWLVAVKGAPEQVLAACAAIVTAEGRRTLTEAERAEWLERTEALALSGRRVLAVAGKSMPTPDAPVYEGLDFHGLVSLLDPPRRDVPEALQQCHAAGIRVVMMTGDHALTARTIAESISLTPDTPEIVSGDALKPLGELSDEEAETVRRADIFARVSPHQKLDLVTVHQRAGDIVAVTGDGVNDAPALKKADIGIAMGLRGTQVAREAAAMVLRDDAFGTIVKAIREGRVIFRNIQTFVTYLLSCNLSEVLVVGLAVLAAQPLPLLPLQILFLNLVTDVFPAFALGASEGEDDVLRQPPRDPSKPMLTRSLWIEIVGYGVLITVATLGALVIAERVLGLTGDALVTVSFLTLAFAQLWNVFNMRDPRASLFINAVTRNPFVWGALALCTGLILAVTYVPATAEVLHLVPPRTDAWLLVLAMSAAPLVIGQIGKEVSGWLYRRAHRQGLAGARSA